MGKKNQRHHRNTERGLTVINRGPGNGAVALPRGGQFGEMLDDVKGFQRTEANALRDDWDAMCNSLARTRGMVGYARRVAERTEGQMESFLIEQGLIPAEGQPQQRNRRDQDDDEDFEPARVIND